MARKAAPKPAAKDAAIGTAEVFGVPISHPAKVMWPDAGDGTPVTKLDLAHYYETVGPWLLRQIKGRPCSILRAPDGFAGAQFFQRHAMPGTSGLLDLVKVAGDRKPYLAINRVAALVSAAQIAGLEVHPWNSQPDHPDIPGRLVFDLDPGPGVGFDSVVTAAKAVKQRLAALGLVAFCKTTGGKGLHVVTPLSAEHGQALGWAEAKGFARTICEHIAAQAPEEFVVDPAKAKRQGRIFLDYLRNDRTATAVAPLSPRARAGATVAMPLQWSQVRTGLDPKAFTLRTVPALLERHRPWADYAEGARPLRPAIKRLEGLRSPRAGAG